MGIIVDVEKKLNDFQLNIKFKTNSRRIGILGASGSGKSLTLKTIAGIVQPDTGKVEIDDTVLFQAEGKKPSVNVKPQQRKVGYLFQNYALFPTMTVAQNIQAGLKGAKEEQEKRVKEMILKFQLEGLEDHYPAELSGGQQQRVALARIMAYEPDVILLDEPFSALDGYLKDRLQQELLEMLEGYPGTVILVSHSRDEIYRFSDELVVIDKGKTICQGPTKKIFADPVYKEAAKLTGCKNLVDAEWMDNHTLLVPDWNVFLRTVGAIDPEVQYVGIRAHDFEPLWEDVELPAEIDGKQIAGKIPLIIKSYAELPFEVKFFVRLKEGCDDICWYVQRESYQELKDKGMPDYIGILEDKLLLLK